MASSSFLPAIPAPDLQALVAPLLPAIPPAAAASDPAPGVLPYLSPILRQRVQLLSSSSSDPWLRLLCYDTTKASRLTEIASSGNLDPHPVSGEVEVDWDYDAGTRFRRLDEETLQALVALPELGLAFQLVYCLNDAAGGGDGWRIGEVTIAETPSPFAQFGGVTTIAEAERQFRENKAATASSKSLAARVDSKSTKPNGDVSVSGMTNGQDEDEDDGYWDRYDATPANRTPALNRSPALASGAVGNQATRPHQASSLRNSGNDDDDEYFSQYDGVQPAMDNYDPDEAVQAAHLDPPLGLHQPQSSSQAYAVYHDGDTNDRSCDQGLLHGHNRTENPSFPISNSQNNVGLLQPRPDSSASSSGSQTVAKLEATAGLQEQSEFGVKQHVSRSIRSLYMLSRASGIDRAEFERLVQTELSLLGMADEQE